MSAVLEQPALFFRPMHDSDADAVMAIESAVYSHGWTRQIFLDCLRAGYSSWVMEGDNEVIGYGMLSLVADEGHLLNVAIAPAQQGKGLGRYFVTYLCDLARERGANTIFLEVRPSNDAAIHLYDSMGFNQVGLRRNYYPAVRGREDAVIMARELIEHAGLFSGEP